MSEIGDYYVISAVSYRSSSNVSTNTFTVNGGTGTKQTNTISAEGTTVIHVNL